jgi:uncharacterized protein YceH (UPF0502 family)
LVVCETVDDPQPAASRAAPTTPSAAALYLVLTISLQEDAPGGETFPGSILALVHLGQLTPEEQRVLGALIEKRWTTPDQYPLSLNSLRLACNQLTNRDPVTQYDEATVRDAAQRLSRYGLARLASGHGSRSVKYRHLAEEGLSLDREELAVLAVLLLRGPQTPGEIKARTERMATFGSLADVERVLGVLSERGYVRRLARRPGQKEDRFEHLLGGEADEEARAPGVVAAAAPGDGATAPTDGNLEVRVATLETEVAQLRQQLGALLQRS